jgi:nicotinamide-nucleotide amidase
MAYAEIDIVSKVHELFKRKGLKLAVAESCTGGLIGHLITSVPESSAFFEASVVCYTKGAKERLLGLGRSFLEKHGTISEETTRAMAEAVRKAAGADVALAITGIMGPEAVEGHKPGLVYVAVSLGVETTSKGFIFEGRRAEVKLSAATEALHYLFEAASIWE